MLTTFMNFSAKKLDEYLVLKRRSKKKKRDHRKLKAKSLAFYNG